MSVSEDKVPGEEVGRLKAKDLDLGENGLVAYRLIDGDGMNVFELTTDSETREAVIKLKKVKISSWTQPIRVGSSEEAGKNMIHFPIIWWILFFLPLDRKNVLYFYKLGDQNLRICPPFSSEFQIHQGSVEEFFE